MSEPLKVHIVTKIARQYEGELIYINILKASTDLDFIKKFVAELEYSPAEVINGVGCVVEIGIIQDVILEGPPNVV